MYIRNVYVVSCIFWKKNTLEFELVLVERIINIANHIRNLDVAVIFTWNAFHTLIYVYSFFSLSIDLSVGNDQTANHSN